MDNQLYCLQGKGVKIPVKLQIFKHGGGIYLAFVGEGVHIPLLASAEIIAAELRQALALIERASATNDQGHISRRLPDKPTLRDLTGDPRNDFPVFVRRFARSSPDVVAAVAAYYKQQGHKVPGVDTILQGYDDLDAIWSVRHKIVNAKNELVYGARTRIASKLGIRDAGNYRQRIDTVIWLLKNTPLEDSGVELEVLEPKEAVSNIPERRLKVANG